MEGLCGRPAPSTSTSSSCSHSGGVAFPCLTCVVNHSKRLILQLVFCFVFSGLGLGTGSSGRRDSFDRNTSAFSPSLDYGRPKWPQNYGALGKFYIHMFFNIHFYHKTSSRFVSIMGRRLVPIGTSNILQIRF